MSSSNFLAPNLRRKKAHLQRKWANLPEGANSLQAVPNAAGQAASGAPSTGPVYYRSGWCSAIPHQLRTYFSSALENAGSPLILPHYHLGQRDYIQAAVLLT